MISLSSHREVSFYSYSVSNTRSHDDHVDGFSNHLGFLGARSLLGSLSKTGSFSDGGSLGLQDSILFSSAHHVGLVGGVSSELSLMSSKCSHFSGASTASSVESHSSGMSKAGFVSSDFLGVSSLSLSCLELKVGDSLGMSSFVEGDQLLLSLPGSSLCSLSSSSS